MKAREKGTNEKFQRVYTIILEDGIQYNPDIIEFENKCATGLDELRNQAAIAAMQAIITNWHNLDSGAFDEYKIGYTAVLCANALIKELESFNGGKPKLRVSKKKKLKVEVNKGE